MAVSRSQAHRSEGGLESGSAPALGADARVVPRALDNALQWLQVAVCFALHCFKLMTINLQVLWVSSSFVLDGSEMIKWLLITNRLKNITVRVGWGSPSSALRLRVTSWELYTVICGLWTEWTNWCDNTKEWKRHGYKLKALVFVYDVSVNRFVSTKALFFHLRTFVSFHN